MCFVEIINDGNKMVCQCYTSFSYYLNHSYRVKSLIVMLEFLSPAGSGEDYFLQQAVTKIGHGENNGAG